MDHVYHICNNVAYMIHNMVHDLQNSSKTVKIYILHQYYCVYLTSLAPGEPVPGGLVPTQHLGGEEGMRRPRVDPLSTHQVGPLDISPSWPIGIMYLSWGYHCFLSRWVPSLMTECLHPIWALCHGNFLGRPTVTSTWGSAGNRTRDPLHCDQILNLLNQQASQEQNFKAPSILVKSHASFVCFGVHIRLCNFNNGIFPINV